MQSLINFWQTLPSRISPDVITIGSFSVKYYGLMYLAAFATVYGLLYYRLKKKEFDLSVLALQDYIFYAVIGLLIGARAGYVLFYNFSYYLMNPLKIISPFEFKDGITFTGIEGLSYHGGLVGVVIVTVIFCLKKKINILRFGDFMIPAVPLGYFFGRIGNFINGELYGRVTDSFIGMVFPLGGPFLRHPSQLYQAFFEGIIVFIILWKIRNIKKFSGFLFSMYLLLSGTFRFFIEFFRQPDIDLGFVFLNFTMGQVLSFFTALAALIIIYFANWEKKRKA